MRTPIKAELFTSGIIDTGNKTISLTKRPAVRIEYTDNTVAIVFVDEIEQLYVRDTLPLKSKENQ